jgi:hypothetical protein
LQGLWSGFVEKKEALQAEKSEVVRPEQGDPVLLGSVIVSAAVKDALREVGRRKIRVLLDEASVFPSPF